MIRKSTLAVVAALIFGSASAALADEHFDLNIYRANKQSSAFATYMAALGSCAQVRHCKRSTAVAKPRCSSRPFARTNNRWLPHRHPVWRARSASMKIGRLA